jgi:PTS system glucose-specific IIA component
MHLFRKRESLTVSCGQNELAAPADGQLIPIDHVNDPVFAKEVMGKSAAFVFPKEKVVLHAPCSGTLTTIFPTGHMFGITREDGVEVLVHIGLDTVKAKGAGFKLLKQQDDPVTIGEPVVEADMKRLAKTYDMTTMLIVTNAMDKDVQYIQPAIVHAGQAVAKLV